MDLSEVEGNKVLKVSVFGHSFVKRLNFFLRNLSEHDIKYLNLYLPADEFDVQLYGIGGLKLTGDVRLHRFDSYIRNSDILILDLGSNCLCDPTLGVFTFVNRLFQYILSLQHELNIKIIAISQILPRGSQPFSGYNNKITIVNEYIDYTLRNGSYPGIYLWRHRCGLWVNIARCLAGDGVHLNVDAGYPRYFQSIRDAILRMKNKLSNYLISHKVQVILTLKSARASKEIGHPMKLKQVALVNGHYHVVVKNEIMNDEQTKAIWISTTVHIIPEVDILMYPDADLT